MKLRKVRIENFRAIKETEIVFADALGAIRPVTVLAGPNGSGKTSVLFAIVQALRGVMGYRTSDVPEPEELDIHRTVSIGGLSPIPPSISVTLDIEFGEERTAIRKVMAEVAPTSGFQSFRTARCGQYGNIRPKDIRTGRLGRSGI